MANVKNNEMDRNKEQYVRQKIEEMEKYNPKYRNSYVETLMHIIRGNVGAGLFAMGDAFKNGGMIVAPLGMFGICVISLHCQHILLTAALNIMEKMQSETTPEFASTFYLTFIISRHKRVNKSATLIRVMINTFLCITQWGFNCIYIVFMSKNINEIFERFDIHIEFHLIMLMWLLPVWGTCMVRNLKYITPFSSLANFLMLGGLVLIFYFLTQDLPPVSSRTYAASWDKVPLFFATTIYAFEGIGLVLPLQREMDNPKQFGKPFGVLNVGTFIIFWILFMVGFFSYLKYGDDVGGTVTINLPKENIITTISQIAVVMAVLFTYSLQFYIPIKVTWPSIVNRFGPFRNPDFGELVYRTLMVLFTFILAEAIPYLGNFISLVGAIGSTALSLLFPPLLEIVLICENSKLTSKHKWTLVKDIVILLLGLIAMFSGTVLSIWNIIQAFQQDYN